MTWKKISEYGYGLVVFGAGGVAADVLKVSVWQIVTGTLLAFSIVIIGDCIVGWRVGGKAVKNFRDFWKERE
jgi:hypothetical protein